MKEKRAQALFLLQFKKTPSIKSTGQNGREK